MAKSHRVWIEIVAMATGIACALALLLASLGAAAGVAVSDGGPLNQPTAAGSAELP